MVFDQLFIPSQGIFTLEKVRKRISGWKFVRVQLSEEHRVMGMIFCSNCWLIRNRFPRRLISSSVQGSPWICFAKRRNFHVLRWRKLFCGVKAQSWSHSSSRPEKNANNQKKLLNVNQKEILVYWFFMQTILDCRLTCSEIDFFLSSEGSRREINFCHIAGQEIFMTNRYNFPNKGAKTFSY